MSEQDFEVKIKPGEYGAGVVEAISTLLTPGKEANAIMHAVAHGYRMGYEAGINAGFRSAVVTEVPKGGDRGEGK